jgi:hypothetical protein
LSKEIKAGKLILHAPLSLCCVPRNSFYENVIDMPYRLCTLATQVVGSAGVAGIEANPTPTNRFR